jgi:hypothetical protein
LLLHLGVFVNRRSGGFFQRTPAPNDPPSAQCSNPAVASAAKMCSRGASRATVALHLDLAAGFEPAECSGLDILRGGELSNAKAGQGAGGTLSCVVHGVT